MRLRHNRGRRIRISVLLPCIFLFLAITSNAQTEVRIDPPKGGVGWLTHPYQAGAVPPVNLSNSSRLDSLVRAGNLYVSAQDVVALAIENNIDVEVQRYGPLLAREVLRRAQSGGPLRTVGAPVAAGAPSGRLQRRQVNACA